MKIREFNKLIKQISDKKKKIIDVSKISSLTNEDRSAMIYFIVRNRQPILKDLIPEGFDYSWLNCMGYLYSQSNDKFSFLTTSEHRIK